MTPKTCMNNLPSRRFRTNFFKSVLKDNIKLFGLEFICFELILTQGPLGSVIPNIKSDFYNQKTILL